MNETALLHPTILLCSGKCLLNCFTIRFCRRNLFRYFIAYSAAIFCQYVSGGVTPENDAMFISEDQLYEDLLKSGEVVL